MIRLSVDVPLDLRLTLDRKAKLGVLRKAGAEVARKARALIRAAGKAGKSVPGGPPVSRTGKLARSIKVRPYPSGDGVAVRASAFYALFLEAGAKGGRGSGKKGVKGRRNKRGVLASGRVLEPRPFLSAALDAQGERALAGRVQDALLNGIALRKAGK